MPQGPILSVRPLEHCGPWKNRLNILPLNNFERKYLSRRHFLALRYFVGNNTRPGVATRMLYSVPPPVM